ncbi:M42 family peptidase [Rubrobacter taiwanensis]|uniref:M42 family peptidase n=1 Tax=Rubrobacter taiwanensis TaxID=185139 RepID=A0A4R1BSG5_9ACTN|nr:M42 family metallopeptidase [Rubrobacter taiwanensis]TCJ20773.1 M42 family peptidase [Rubrobacter taiwanensis]
MREESLSFLKALLSTPGPSGYEEDAARLWREEAAKFSGVRGDRMGNSFATLNAGGRPRIMLSGHIDEIGLIVTHIGDDGRVYFKGIGGWDSQVLVGQRVLIRGRSGDVRGVIGKKAVHTMSAEERKKVSEIKDLWIDVGARDGEEAREMVRVGDAAVLDHGLLELPNGRIASRSVDDRIGAFIVLEALRLLAESGGFSAEVVAVASVQEEIGAYGARGSAYGLDPDAAVAVDVTHATDITGVSRQEHGDHSLGSGPVITRASVLSPVVTAGLMEAAEREGIPYTLEADSGRTGTDADAIHLSRAGIACGVVSAPNRYMHSPNEMVELRDLENCARLIAAWVRTLTPETDFIR